MKYVSMPVWSKFCNWFRRQCFRKGFSLVTLNHLLFIKVFPMMYLLQFGQNLTIGSGDRVQTRLFH